MRRRRRTDGGVRGRDGGGCGSLMYYLDAHEESERSARESDADVRQCALVHNVVGTARIAVTPGPLDLRLANTLLPNSSFVKKKFAAITVRLHEPTCTILLFGSGKCVLTGCRDFVSCIRAVYDVLEVLRRGMHGVHFAVETIQMQNIVGHADLELKGQQVDLGRFYADHNIECTFQRTMFPGLVYRSSESNVVLLVFRSGRIVLTGGRDIYCLNAAWRRMKPLLARYVVDVVEDTDSRGASGGRPGKAGTWSKSAAPAAAVYVAEAGKKDDERVCGTGAYRRVDGDVPAKRARVRRGGGGGGGVAADAREAAAEPPHERGP
jgi:transcription initiation factor TFIID TATA-box-binding protein